MSQVDAQPPRADQAPAHARRVHLPVLTGALGDYRPAVKSGLRRYRALVLASLYILMAAHVAHWLLAGRTLGPVVFSESMYALELGRVNPGFIFFVVALAATLVFGRFLCGWACHMAALQELCGWMLVKLGIRPRPFRARLLGYVPLALALYMFVWPTLKREAIIPALRQWWPGALTLIKPVAEFPGFSSALITDNLWSPLPGIIVCVVFLLISGFGMVLFLGARGLCRYGCPYGGVFRYVEQLAPGRVVVDPALCDRCGRCTAVCSTGVRILDELQAYGMVVDRDCVRSLDCVSVCPTGALKFRFTKPAIFKVRPAVPRTPVHYDASWGEELLLVGALGLTLLVARGLYERIGLLMAVSIAMCVAFVAWKLLHLLRRRDARLLGLQLKRAGSLHPAGVALAGLGLVIFALLAHSAGVRILLWRAGQIDARVTIAADQVFSGDPAAIPAQAKADAAHALRLYSAAAPFTRGGIALADTPGANIREAWLNLVVGNAAQAETALRRVAGAPIRADAPLNRVLGTRVPTDALATDLARTMLLQGKATDAAEYLAAIVEANPGFRQSLDALVAIHARAGRVDQAQSLYQRALDRSPHDANLRTALAGLHLSQGRAPAAVTLLRQAALDAPADAYIRHALATAEFYAGDIDAAVDSMTRAAQLDRHAAPTLLRQAADMLQTTGRENQARALEDQAAALENQHQAGAHP